MFRWLKRQKNQERISGDTVDLVHEKDVMASRFNNYVASRYYGIYVHGTQIRAGYCDLRLGMNEELYYAGNIGYHIEPAYRGHGYAYEACLMLFDIARQEDMQEIIITCSPENTPSRKTLEKLNGELLETTDVPPSHWLYRRGETVKNIYQWKL
ncbi:MAG: GNAT family N-acetyltransferase [Solobacterium sp.]|nr:GNAT family N-acetyltransferase [Solobacterium sp.]